MQRRGSESSLQAEAAHFLKGAKPGAEDQRALASPEGPEQMDIAAAQYLKGGPAGKTSVQAAAAEFLKSGKSPLFTEIHGHQVTKEGPQMSGPWVRSQRDRGGSAQIEEPQFADTQQQQQMKEECTTDSVDTSAAELAVWVMSKADRHCTNGKLTVNELRTYLPDHPLTDWVTKRRGALTRYDSNHDGVLSMVELRIACGDFLQSLQLDTNTPSDRTGGAILAGLDSEESQKTAQTQLGKYLNSEERSMSRQMDLQGEDAGAITRMQVEDASFGLHLTSTQYDNEQARDDLKLRHDPIGGGYSADENKHPIHTEMEHFETEQTRHNGDRVTQPVMGGISEDTQDRIKAGFVRTQMKGYISEEMQDSIRVGLMHTHDTMDNNNFLEVEMFAAQTTEPSLDFDLSQVSLPESGAQLAAEDSDDSQFMISPIKLRTLHDLTNAPSAEAVSAKSPSKTPLQDLLGAEMPSDQVVSSRIDARGRKEIRFADGRTIVEFGNGTKKVAFVCLFVCLFVLLSGLAWACGTLKRFMTGNIHKWRGTDTLPEW